MIFRALADAVLVMHLLFILFVIGGGFLLLRWPKVAWAHIPVALWGAVIEFTGWICPLTPLENSLRRAAGDTGYSGGFIEHYLVPTVYPAHLTPDIQFGLGVAVVGVNLMIYAWVWHRKRGG